MTLEIRLALPTDAAAIGRVHAQSWREAYAGILSDAWVAAVSDEERIARWQLNLAASEGTTWVAELDGEIVGFVTSGPARDRESPRDLELWSIYLLASAGRRGIGTAMAQASIAEAPAMVWVLEGNADAQSFYRELGFVPDGARRTLDYWENVTDIRMVR